MNAPVRLALLPLAAGTLCAVVTVLVLLRFRLYSRRVRLLFSLLVLSGALWATAYGFQVAAQTLPGKLLWYRLGWVGAAAAPTLLVAFSLAYAGEDRLFDRSTVAALAVEPLLVIGLVSLGGEGGLFVASYELRSVPSGGVALAVRYGPLYAVHLLYGAGTALAGGIVTGRLLVRGDGAYRRGPVVLLLAAAVPTLALGTRTLGLWAHWFDPVPASLGLSAAVVLAGLRTDSLFDVTPVARDRVFSEMRDGIVVLDDRAHVVEANPAAGVFFTCPRSDAIGSHVAEVSHNAPGVQALLDADRDVVELTVEGDDGPRFFEATATPLSAAGGRERGWTLVLRDVTDRRQTEAQFRALIENSRDLIAVLDETGRAEYVSPSASHVLGTEATELTGEHAFDRIHPDDRDDVREQFRATVEDAAALRTQFRARHADGSWRVLDVVGVNLFDDPAVGGVVINARDVTHRHRYEQRLRVLNRVLRHDLRNDMNVVLGHADILIDADVDPETKEHARKIQRKAESLVDLGERARQVDHTLDHAERERRPVEITEPIRSELDGLSSEYPGTVVHRHLPDEQWVYATDHVSTAIRNVVENAVEHNDRVLTRVGAAVTPRPETGQVEVRIVDNGPGIPRSELEALRSGTETQLRHVSGLGLWLVKWILSGSDASIEFESHSPRGTAVVMTFSAADPPGGAPSALTTPDVFEFAEVGTDD
jgi:PAS domain S-box-containing protein